MSLIPYIRNTASPDVALLRYNLIPGDTVTVAEVILGKTIGEISDLPSGSGTGIEGLAEVRDAFDGVTFPWAVYYLATGEISISRPIAPTLQYPYTHVTITLTNPQGTSVFTGEPYQVGAPVFVVTETVTGPHDGDDPSFRDNNPDYVFITISPPENPYRIDKPKAPGRFSEEQKAAFEEDAKAIEKITNFLELGGSAGGENPEAELTKKIAVQVAEAANPAIGQAASVVETVSAALERATGEGGVSPIGATFTVATVANKGMIKLLKTLADDPPEGHYDEVYQTPGFGFAGITGASDAANGYLHHTLEAVRALIDALTAAERFQGADLAGDVASRAIQEAAYDAALDKYLVEKQAINVALADLQPEISALPDIDLSEDATELAEAQAHYAGLANPVADDPYLHAFASRLVADYPPFSLILPDIVAGALAGLAAAQPEGLTGSAKALFDEGRASFAGQAAAPTGDEGANLLIDGNEAHVLFGLGGDDTMVGGAGLDQLWGGDGNDTVSYFDAVGSVYADLRGGVGLVGGALADSFNSVEDLKGGYGGGDLLVGDDGPNRLDGGGGGGDLLFGMDGTDVLLGGTAPPGTTPNQLWGGDGSDTAAYSGQDPLYLSLASQAGFLLSGGAYPVLDTYDSIENLTGGTGNDVIVGDAGANVITGSRGFDQLYGRAGADTFVYTAVQDSDFIFGYDTIADFETGVDKLDLRALQTNTAHVLIVSDGVSTAIYGDTDAGWDGYEFGLVIAGANAAALSDLIL